MTRLLANRHGGLSEYLKLLGYRRFHYLWWPKSSANMTVLLHGLGECSDTYGPFASRIRRSSEIIAMDLRGHGGTPWDPDGQYGFNEYADDLHLQLSYWQRKAVLAGTGLGALLAIRASERWPDLVGGLVLLGPPPDDVKVAGLVDLVTGTGWRRNIPVRGSSVHARFRNSRHAYLGPSRWVEGPKIRSGGNKCRKPTGLNRCRRTAGADADYCYPRGRAGLIGPTGRTLRKVVINGVGKWPHIANPMGAADVVNAFLDDLSPGDHGDRLDSP